MIWIALAVGVALIVVIMAGREGPDASDGADQVAGGDDHALDVPRVEAADRPMTVTRMKVWGVLRIAGPDGTLEEIFPPSPHGEGEFPTAIWGDADGTAWITAKLYGGDANPDHGVIYRRTPDGAWHFDFVLENYTLHSIVEFDGVLYAGAIGGYVFRQDGAWTSVRLPEYAMMWKVFVDAEGAWIRNWDGEFCYRLDGSERTPVQGLSEPDVDQQSFTHAGATWTVFDRSEEVEEVELSPEEAAEIRAEFAALRAAIADGTAKVKRLG